MASNPFADFVWSIGEEGSDPVVTKDGADYRHDQFAQSGHDVLFDTDLAAIAELGVEVVRYGTPWRLAEPEPGVYDWSRWDIAFEACARHHLEPVVEFLHFGLPDHYPGFVDDGWVDGFCRYVDAFIARYDEPRFFTPVNEPGVTALLSARLGLWNDRASDAVSHVAALGNVVLANLEAMARVLADRNGWWISSEGFDMPVAVTEEATDAARTRRDLHWLVWDLHFGIESPPVAESYLAPMSDATRSRIAGLTLSDRLVAGLDVYPSSIHAVGGTPPQRSIDDRIQIIVDHIADWHHRYRHPFWIAETSNLTLDVSEQIDWLDAFTAGLARLRADGLPARGLCWYSRGDQFDWQTALTNPVGAVTEVGLFDTERRARPVATRFKHLANAGPPISR